VAKFSKSRVWVKVPEERALIFEDAQILVRVRWNEASMPKTSSIRLVVLTQYRLVTDRQTDEQTGTMTAITALALRRALKSEKSTTIGPMMHESQLYQNV